MNRMQGSGAATLREVDVKTNGNALHVSIEPTSIPEPQLLDAKGEPVVVKKGLMVKVDERLKEPANLSKGTVIGVSIVGPILMLALNYGTTIWNKSAEDAAVKTRVEQIQAELKSRDEQAAKERLDLRSEMRELNKKVDDLKDKFSENQIKDAEKRGFLMRQEAEKGQ